MIQSIFPEYIEHIQMILAMPKGAACLALDGLIAIGMYLIIELLCDLGRLKILQRKLKQLNKNRL